MLDLTWNKIATIYPEHVQKHVQKYGPLPDGPVTEAQWEQFRNGEQVTEDETDGD